MLTLDLQNKLIDFVAMVHEQNTTKKNNPNTPLSVKEEAQLKATTELISLIEIDQTSQQNKSNVKKKTEKTGISGILNDSNRYKSSKGEISLVTPCMATMDMYEIYCIEGDLFEDIERYNSLQEAEDRIYQLLT